MVFETPYGTADDQSASYICGLEEGLAIGAITGGVGSTGTGTLPPFGDALAAGMVYFAQYNLLPISSLVTVTNYTKYTIPKE